MFEIVYRCNPTEGPVQPRPTNANEARARLLRGNEQFAKAAQNAPPQEVVPIDLDGLGIDERKDVPPQKPFAAVLSCSDARAPVEMLFRQACNDLFVVRLAGNVMTDEGVGSLGYAVQNLDENVKLIVVLGHSCCGAVTAAVDAYLTNPAFGNTASDVGLKAIVERILTSANTASQALERAGITRHSNESLYRERLLEMSIVLNAAMTAMSIQGAMAEVANYHCPAVYGIYDLATRLVRAPQLESMISESPQSYLADPPSDIGEFKKLADQLASSMVDLT